MVQLRVNLPQLDRIIRRLEVAPMLGPPLREALEEGTRLLQEDAEARRPRDKGMAIGPITAEVDAADVPRWGRVSVTSKKAKFRVPMALNFARTRYHYRHWSHAGQLTTNWYTGAKRRQGSRVRALFQNAIEKIVARWQA